jgi:hypothetical protein
VFVDVLIQEFGLISSFLLFLPRLDLFLCCLSRGERRAGRRRIWSRLDLCSMLFNGIRTRCFFGVVQVLNSLVFLVGWARTCALPRARWWFSAEVFRESCQGNISSRTGLLFAAPPGSPAHKSKEPYVCFAGGRKCNIWPLVHNLSKIFTFLGSTYLHLICPPKISYGTTQLRSQQIITSPQLKEGKKLGPNGSVYSATYRSVYS